MLTRRQHALHTWTAARPEWEGHEDDPQMSEDCRHMTFEEDLHGQFMCSGVYGTSMHKP